MTVSALNNITHKKRFYTIDEGQALTSNGSDIIINKKNTFELRDKIESISKRAISLVATCLSNTLYNNKLWFAGAVVCCLATLFHVFAAYFKGAMTFSSIADKNILKLLFNITYYYFYYLLLIIKLLMNLSK